MKNLFLQFSAFIFLLFGLSGTAGAYTINYDYAANGNSYTSPYTGVQVETFDNPTLLWNWSGNGAIVKNSSSGKYAAPYGVLGPDATKYVTVPQDLLPVANTFTAQLTGTHDYLGLWWGSVDTYNTLSFYNDGSLVATITGSNAIKTGAANGNQIAPSTNLYVNILGLEYDSFSMTSTRYAFEADNIAVGNVVPEPGTMLLLSLGLSGLAGLAGFRKIIGV